MEDDTMVNICGKCKHFMRSETTNDGYFYHYCNKADELFPPQPEESEPQPDSAEKTKHEVPILKIKFNDAACQYYEKRRQ